MPVPKQLAGVRGDECQCGRRASVRHCTSCGSSRSYGYAQPQWHQKLDGSMEKVRLYRCIACGHQYTDAEREFCEAPPITAALAAQKLQAVSEASKSGEYLNPAEVKLAEALDKLLKSPTHSEETRQKLKTQLQGVYSDMILTESQRLNVSPEEIRQKESMDSYIERHLLEFEQQLSKTNSDSKPQETEPDEDASAKKREYSLEWSRYRFIHGRTPTPTVDEYVQRRLAGEVFS